VRELRDSSKAKTRPRHVARFMPDQSSAALWARNPSASFVPRCSVLLRERWFVLEPQCVPLSRSMSNDDLYQSLRSADERHSIGDSAEARLSARLNAVPCALQCLARGHRQAQVVI
jgi:hypothetical protein